MGLVGDLKRPLTAPFASTVVEKTAPWGTVSQVDPRCRRAMTWCHGPRGWTGPITGPMRAECRRRWCLDRGWLVRRRSVVGALEGAVVPPASGQVTGLVSVWSAWTDCPGAWEQL